LSTRPHVEGDSLYIWLAEESAWTKYLYPVPYGIRWIGEGIRSGMYPQVDLILGHSRVEHSVTLLLMDMGI
jgi:hypothetical protein